MKFAVDARWMVGNYRGMGQYAHGIISPIKHNIVALLPEGSYATDMSAISQGHPFFPYWEQRALPQLCITHGVDEILCPYNTGPINLADSIKMTLVVHDLIYLEPWLKLPPSISPYQTLGRIYRRFIVPKAVQRANKIITVSEYTRTLICERFSVAEKDVVVIPNSLDSSWYSGDQISSFERGRYLLTVSGEASSKNLPALLRAFKLFKRRGGNSVFDVKLRIVGIKQAYQQHFFKIAQGLGIESFVMFEPFLTEDALKELYKKAWLFVMPSLYEGFGIPVLEAMACGTPVVCSDTTSLPEVVGEAGWLFDPRDAADMADKIYLAWTDELERSKRIQLGIERASVYSRKNVEKEIKKFWHDTN